jgi:hypothetical protein
MNFGERRICDRTRLPFDFGFEAKFSGTPPGWRRTVSGGQLPSPGGKNRLISAARDSRIQIRETQQAIKRSSPGNDQRSLY